MITRISKRRRNRQGKEVWKFVSAAVAITSIFIIYPIVYSLVLSMYRTRGLSSRFVGLGNIQRMFGDAVFLKALGNNLIYLVFQVPLMLVLGLFLAVLVNSPKLKFRTFFRLALFLPCVISLVAYSILFKMMFQTDGLINNFLMAIYVISKPINWLNDPFWAKVTIIIALCWRWTGYNMMFFLSGLQTISGNTLEAAEIDGANGLKKFFLVIVPQLKPIILFTTIMS
ncbi:MAG: sugar ABC transporter permease, partial [Clostridiales bacterium]|nr:sugar ABC transporter permease [Clostridiales bacterium]